MIKKRAITDINN